MHASAVPRNGRLCPYWEETVKTSKRTKRYFGEKERGTWAGCWERTGNGSCRNNFNGKVCGPWVFGMIDVESGELRIVRVRRRDTLTLCREIQRHVAPGTTITTDEWAAYRRIPALRDAAGVSLDYTHLTVNHCRQFVNPRNGAHTQNIESAWGPAKALLVRTMEGWSGPSANTPRGRAEADRMLQTYLDWCWWLYINGPTKCKDTFLRLLETIARQYPQS